MHELKESQIIDTVYTIVDYYDGCQTGAATFEGDPCVFERISNKTVDDWSKKYYLKLISQDELSLLMKDWEEWLCWLDKFDKGQAELNTHPFIRPSNREETNKIYTINKDNAVIVEGTFQGPWRHPEKMSVEWIRLNDNEKEPVM